MNADYDSLQAQWRALRERLCARELLGPPRASVSMRIPGGGEMWFGELGDAAPRRLSWRDAQGLAGDAALHAAVYRARPDAGGITAGGGAYGNCLADFGGTMPQVFDEQARHLGAMGAPAQDDPGLARALADGGNVALLGGRPVCLGMTATRLALNAELFEKCAKAYVLAAAAGGPVRPLPWLVRRIANGRLRKDARRAVQRFAQGLLPEEARGY